ncbi:helix-turn-helix domain-containing protein [Symbiopectobacterium sp.]|uniref:helix-turn-helix domain-containing protein n=1 Tax=Symbiopectobacterium sp. TaxID=2952789 RepID=UPI003F394CA0
MSRIATDWAWSLNLPSSQKLLLLSLADRADEQHCCYPSIQRLVSDTGLERKTIGKGINQMIDEGLISDTGERKGPTKRVRVLQLNIGSKCAQKRNDTKNGNVTKNRTLNDPNIGTLNDTKNGILNDPKIGTLNQSLEPNIEPEKNIPLPLTDKKNKFDPLTEKPSNVSAEVWADWVSHRKEIRHPLTPTTCKRIRSMLENHVNPDAVISLSIERGWQGLFPEKITEPANTTPAFDVSRLTEEQRRELALYELLEGR